MTWTGGTLSGSGTTQANGGLAIVSGVLDQQTLINEATATYGGADTTAFYLDDGATLDNAPTGAFTITDDSSILGVSAQPMNGGVFDNQGVLSKNGGSGNSGIYVAIDQSGRGSLQVDSGSLYINYASTFASTGI